MQRDVEAKAIFGRSEQRLRCALLVHLFALASIGLVTREAIAQPTPRAEETPVEGEIVPPKLASPANVVYPPKAKGDAVVVLKLTIEADGTVRSVETLDGEAPFTAVAVKAAKGWRFEPATRDGRPLAAIIRFEVTFKAPVPMAPQPDEAKGEAQASPTQPPTPSSTPEPIDVVIRGERPAPMVSTLTRAEVRQLPGAFGDPFRAIEILPGVTPVASGLPFFYVRGAPPGNTGYYLDGVRVPYLYHIGLGPSVVHPGLVDSVSLYPGGYPAQFGGFTGGIVSGTTKDPQPELHGEGNLRLFDVGAMVETGFDDGRGTVLLGGRYSYTAAILSLIAGDVALDYRDFQARTSYDITPQDRVSLFSFGSYDLLGERKEDGTLDILFGTEFYRTDLRYDHKYAEDSNVRFGLTLGYDQTRIARQRNAIDKLVGGRVVVRHRVNDDIVLRTGADLTVDAYDPGDRMYEDPDDPQTKKREELFPNRNDIALGGWVDCVLDLTPGVQLTTGVRVMLFASGGESAVGVDPRIAARFEVSDSVRIVHAYGITHQPPSFFVPVPGLVPTLGSGLQSSFQTSAGMEWDITESTTSTATVFHNAFFDMTDTIGTSSGEFDLISTDRSMGSAMGFELFVKRKLTHRLGGFVSYTLSQSLRSMDREKFPSAFDRTHVANAAIAYDLGRKWLAGSRLVFYTGAPKTSPTDGLILAPRPRHPERSPSFYRLDLRLEKRWPMGGEAWLSAVFEVMNATLRKETFASTTGNDESIGPVTIPSIGVEGGF